MLTNAPHPLIAPTLALGWLACGVVPTVDSGAPEAGIEPRIVLGTGEAEFVEVGEGATMQLVTGCQGSQHVWTSLRVFGLEPERAIVTLSLERLRDMEQVGLLQLRIDLTPVDGGAELVGLTLVVPDPELALDQDLLLRGHVRDAEGGEAEAAHPVRLEWGPPGCPGHG